MSTVLIVVGLVFMVVGLGFFVWPREEVADAQGVIGDIGTVIGKINDLLDRVDKRYRPGVVLMAFGLALVGLGIFLETKDAKNAADAAKTTAVVLSLRG